MKKNIVIAAVTASVALFSSNLMAVGLHGCPTKNTVYSAYNLKNTKAVELCELGGGNYRYTFGPRNKPELIMTKPRSEIQFVTGMAGGFSITNGVYEYTVLQDKYGNGALDVYKNNKTLANIPLDVEGPGYVDNSYKHR